LFSKGSTYDIAKNMSLGSYSYALLFIVKETLISLNILFATKNFNGVEGELLMDAIYFWKLRTR